MRLKMYVEMVKATANSAGEIVQEEISLRAVMDGSEANKAWSQWTPSGCLSFMVTNPAAMGKTLVGQFRFIDLIPCEKDSI